MTFVITYKKSIMEIVNLNLKRQLLFSFLFLVLGVGAYGQNPTLPSSSANANCTSCVPTGWQKGPGTPDISNATTAAIAGSVIGAGASWNPTLPSVPNGHTRWISIRDVGNAGAEESLYAPMTNLVPNWEYEVSVYSLTAITNTISGSYLCRNLYR